jgi:hypothetical protein
MDMNRSNASRLVLQRANQESFYAGYGPILALEDDEVPKQVRQAVLREIVEYVDLIAGVIKVEGQYWIWRTSR